MGEVKRKDSTKGNIIYKYLSIFFLKVWWTTSCLSGSGVGKYPVYGVQLSAWCYDSSQFIDRLIDWLIDW